MKKYIGLVIVCILGGIGAYFFNISTPSYTYGFIVGGIAMCVMNFLDDDNADDDEDDED